MRAVSEQTGIDAATVQRALGLRSLYLAGRLLWALRNGDRAFRTADDFVAAAEEMMDARVEEKLGFLFRMCDEDADGMVTRVELERFLHISLAENDVTLGREAADELVHAMMSAGDVDGDRCLSLSELSQMTVAHETLKQRLADHGVALLMPGERAREEALEKSWRRGGWLRNGALPAVWLGLLALANVALFAHAVLRYRHLGANVYIQIARGCGACLNFVGALLAVPMLRRTLTWIRRSFLGAVIPVDDAIDAHALLGQLLVLYSCVHGGAHVLNAMPSLLLGTIPRLRAMVTGTILLVLVLVIWFFSRNAVRRSGRFELFHFTHLAYVAVVPLLFVHGPVFWMWGTLPWGAYLVERLMRGYRRGLAGRVVSARPLTSGVTRLELDRPRGFEYAAGDYIFLRLPDVARHEWHPFTLTSAPEDRRRITVHVRSLGNWSSAVRKVVPERLDDGVQPIAYVDGPYGTPTRHLLDTPHAVAIGAGIGVTPFASILQSLLARSAERGGEPLALRKLHFIWLSRDQYSFEWFRDLLAEFEKRDERRLLDIRIFMTNGRADMAGSLLDTAREVLRARGEGDILTGLRSQTTLGAPDIGRLLDEMCATPDLPPPRVFFCGPPPLGRIIGRSCTRLGLRFRRERF
jgi:hypothetical protein